MERAYAALVLGFVLFAPAALAVELESERAKLLAAIWFFGFGFFLLFNPDLVRSLIDWIVQW